MAKDTKDTLFLKLGFLRTQNNKFEQIRGFFEMVSTHAELSAQRKALPDVFTRET